MKSPSPSDHKDKDREIIELLKSLGSLESRYPQQLLAARRAAFITQVDLLRTDEPLENLSAEDQGIVQLLRNIKSTQAAYPPELLAARRYALLQQMERAGATSLMDELRSSIQRIFGYRTPDFLRLSLLIGGLVAAVLLGSLFFRQADPSSPPVAAVPTQGVVPNTGKTAILICNPQNRTSRCPPGELDPSQDLADQRNGAARPAISKDARHGEDGVYKAAYVNDGHSGASWVSNSPDSWIKIDLGKVTAINAVSLRKGSVPSSNDNDPGQFVIAVALSDEYADGDSSNDYVEYAQVFHSEQAGFSGTVSQAEMIQTQFPTVQARFVKITFEKAGVAIEEVGVFMVQPPVLAEEPTRSSQDDLPMITLTPVRTGTVSPSDTATSAPTDTRLPTGTAVPSSTSTPVPSDTSTPLPTNTRTPTDTSTPVPTVPLPSETLIPYPTSAPPTAEPTQVSSAPIVVTGNGQTITFICNGNAAEIYGHANSITLLGSCSSITVTGNGNQVFWEYGSPVIIDRGNNNSIRQL